MKTRFVIFKNSDDDNFIVNVQEIRAIVQKEQGSIIELLLKNRSSTSTKYSTVIRLNNTFTEVVCILQNIGLL